MSVIVDKGRPELVSGSKWNHCWRIRRRKFPKQHHHHRRPKAAAANDPTVCVMTLKCNAYTYVRPVYFRITAPESTLAFSLRRWKRWFVASLCACTLSAMTDAFFRTVRPRCAHFCLRLLSASRPCLLHNSFYKLFPLSFVAVFSCTRFKSRVLSTYKLHSRSITTSKNSTSEGSSRESWTCISRVHRRCTHVGVLPTVNWRPFRHIRRDTHRIDWLLFSHTHQ